jgi:dihydroorotate dehydrogenase electron transfer subunit
MPKRIESLQVIENKHLTHDIFILELFSATPLPEMKPGQFVQVKVEGSPETFLRRPLSVHDVNYEKKTIKLLVQIAGKGTGKLSELKPGESLNIIYPLGNSFTVPQKAQKILLAGGGCGVAPLLFLGKYLKNQGFIPDILLGFRNSERIIEDNEYAEIGKVYLTTEDGSLGEKGYITDHPVLSTQKYDIIYCCGPDPMMRAIAKYCKKNNTDCEVSLEKLMGCGIGACLCCIVETVKGNLCTCTDGPVFNINTLKW